MVAALQAGARESRATRALGELERRPAPDVLERLAVEAVDPLRAPRVLSERVAAHVEEPESVLVRTLITTLPRHAAPADLAMRLAAQGGLAPRAPRRFRLRSSFGARVALLCAATLLAVVAGGGFRSQPDDGRGAAQRADAAALAAGITRPGRPPLPLTFEVVRHASLASAAFSADQRALAGILTGEVTGGAQ